MSVLLLIVTDTFRQFPDSRCFQSAAGTFFVRGGNRTHATLQRLVFRTFKKVVVATQPEATVYQGDIRQDNFVTA